MEQAVQYFWVAKDALKVSMQYFDENLKDPSIHGEECNSDPPLRNIQQYGRLNAVGNSSEVSLYYYSLDNKL